MPEVVLVEDGCCRAGELDPYRDFLAERLEGRATVTKYGVGGNLGFSAVPPELTNRLLAQGANSIPLVAVNGELVFQGEIPDWEESLRLIEARLDQSASVEQPA
jgi:hypothetical protein